MASIPKRNCGTNGRHHSPSRQTWAGRPQPTVTGTAHRSGPGLPSPSLGPRLEAVAGAKDSAPSDSVSSRAPQTQRVRNAPRGQAVASPHPRVLEELFAFLSLLVQAIHSISKRPACRLLVLSSEALPLSNLQSQGLAEKTVSLAEW